MAKLSQRDADDLTWFFRFASGDISGIQAQRYEREGGTSTSDPEKIQDRQLAACKRWRAIDERVSRLLQYPLGAQRLSTLQIAFGEPERDDPVVTYEETSSGKRTLVRGGLPAEIAPLARHTPSALEAGRALRDATENPNHQIPETAWAAEAIRREIGLGKKATGQLLLTVQVEARGMLEVAGNAYASARESVAAEARPFTDPLDGIRNLAALVEQMRAAEKLEEGEAQ